MAYYECYQKIITIFLKGGKKMTDKKAKRIFLRKVLYRIDFQYITEKTQEDIFTFISQRFRDNFTERGCEQTNEFDIQINSNFQTPPQFNTRPQPVYYLFKQKDENNDGAVLKIGKTFIFLDLDLTVNSTNISYYEWFAEIIDYLKETQIFKPTRIGLRKFNAFYILDKNINDLNKIFSTPFCEQSIDKKFILDHFTNTQVFNEDNYSLNYIKGYSTGILSNETLKLKDEVAHQINFDFDLYSDKQEEIEEFCKDAKIGLEKMNNKIYGFFSNVVKKDVNQKLNNGESLEEYNIILF